jgi:hypothetical protein
MKAPIRVPEQHNHVASFRRFREVTLLSARCINAMACPPRLLLRRLQAVFTDRAVLRQWCSEADDEVPEAIRWNNDD